ncbi:hypothetical protein JAB1_30320 [Janthinobacterium sp. MP5059B]|uniref:hypothetical protein n=1 Tax=Janthinobacterium TaxID=29580 RepID=UPI0005364E13|nr:MULTISPECIES: hypothetical protein [Janthinobacterium]KHA75891.1 hypothetical protein NC77_26805 [Janthinobacterium lividum]OEZ48733.1 hypothetical protein JAB1_30320 [Janthinobacterium sp. MP5059B]QKY02719.1 hypothetical protein G3257_10990 [Janthinobacterium lividum]
MYKGHALKACRTVTLLAVLCFSATAQAQSQAQRDTEYLQEFVVPLAKLQLEKQGHFLPLGAALKQADKFVLMPASTAAMSLLPADIIKLIQEALVQGAVDGEYKTTALVYDATVPLPSSGKQSDAIAVALDHRDGYSIITFLPYELRGKKVHMGTPFTRQGTATVFKQQ